MSGGFSFSKTKSSSISSGVNGDLERELGVRERFLDFFKDSPLSIERERDLERDCERVLDLDLCFRFLCFFLSLDLCFLCLCFLERFSFETSPLLLSAFLEESRSSSFPTLPSIMYTDFKTFASSSETKLIFLTQEKNMADFKFDFFKNALTEGNAAQ